MAFEFTQVVAQLVDAVASVGELEGGDYSLMDLLGGPAADVAGVRLFGSGYRSRHYHPRIPNRQTRRHRIARGNAQHRSGGKFQICLASCAAEMEGDIRPS